MRRDGPPPTTNQIRTVAVVFGALFGMAGYVGWTELRAHGAASVCLVVGALFLSFGLFSPRTLEGFYELWMTVTYPIGWLMSRLVLTAYFFLILTPWGLLMRLAGANPLDLRFKEAGVDSYWEPFDMTKRQPNHFERQF